MRPDDMIEPSDIDDTCLLQGSHRIGHGCVIGPRTIMKWGSTLTAGTRIGADCLLGPYSICLGDPAGKAGPTVIGDRVMLGAHALVAPGVSICDDVIIGAQSYVKHDITVPGTYCGVGSGLWRLR